MPPIPVPIARVASTDLAGAKTVAGLGGQGGSSPCQPLPINLAGGVNDHISSPPRCAQ